MFKEMPIIEGKDAYKNVMKYFVLCLTAYKAVAETIYDRLINVHIVLQIIAPLISGKDNAKWSHTANLLK